MRMAMDLFTEEELAALDPSQPEPGKEGDKKPKADLLDGVPEWFIGPMMRDLTEHEVGHTLGLRHNFRASSIYTLSQINSDEVKGKKAFTASVMDYTAANLTVKDGKLAGDITMIEVGPYDYWAIEYGYGTGDLKEVLKRNTDPLLTYGTDEDVGGGDPLIRRYDFAKDPISYAKEQMELVRYHRGRLLDKFVKDGESWAKARRGYDMTLGVQ
ncbi:MAG: zinc-dependent metalloprotease, partial [Phycisphaerales bacterium]